ncbi:MAG: PatB family C-S lyase [Chloroflexota bacterium]
MTTPSKTYDYDFDTVHDRTGTASIKWSVRMGANRTIVPIKDTDVPLWVADMDFPNPPEIREALKERIDHGFYGYTFAPDELREVIVAEMKSRYDWEIQPEWLVFNPGMVLFLNTVTATLTKQGAGILMNTPVYGPFLTVPAHLNRFAQRVPMVRVEDDAHTFHYEIDFDAFEAAITPQTEMYYLCSPHNPAGKAFTRAELEKLADICLRHNIRIASDDIHADLLLGDAEHIPIATISPEIAAKTITMIAGTKTYNMAGLACSVAIVQDPTEREKIQNHSFGSGFHVDTLAFEALLAGYKYAGNWLTQVRHYIAENRDYAVRRLREELPMLKTAVPDATYLQWIDCTMLDVPEQYATITDYFAEEAGVVFSCGTFFGQESNGYVRLNLATPRALVAEGIDRVVEAVNKLG